MLLLIIKCQDFSRTCKEHMFMKSTFEVINKYLLLKLMSFL